VDRRISSGDGGEGKGRGALHCHVEGGYVHSCEYTVMPDRIVAATFWRPRADVGEWTVRGVTTAAVTSRRS
jgi:UDP-N-acetylglucosamine enolpyruvyl transferase